MNNLTKYKIIILQQFYSEILSILDYSILKLQNYNFYHKLQKQIYNSISALEFFPERYPIIFIYNNKTACNFFRRKNTLKNFTKSLYFSILSFTFAKPLRQCPSLPRHAAPFFSEDVPVFRRHTRQPTFRTG